MTVGADHGDPAVADIVQRHAIYDVVARYCRGIDRVDMDLVRSAYHPDGIDHHTGFEGSIDEFVAWVEPALRGLAGTMHTMGNHVAEIRDCHAAVETYATAVHWVESTEDPRNFTSGVRYVDWMQYRQGRWAIVERWAVREWTRSEAGQFVNPGVAGPRPRRDGDDPLYRLQSRLEMR